MPSAEITKITRDYGRVNVVMADGTTVHFGNVELLRRWIACEPKRCDEALHAALSDILAIDPELKSPETVQGVKYESAVTWTKTEASK